MHIDEFPETLAAPVLAGDTETYTYIDGIRVSEDEIQRIFSMRDSSGQIIHNQSWAREHVTVRAYAWLLSDGEHFAMLETFDDFCQFCVQHHVKTIWWYNAKFDFAFIDYAILTDNWTLCKQGKLKSKQYRSLHGEQGQRYKLTLCKAYKRTGFADRHIRGQQWSNYDFMNIFPGGLAANLASFQVTDYAGNAIRKLEMDYQGETNEDSIAYMKNDVHGLFHLVRIASVFLEKECGYTLLCENPEIITAGGLAKRTLLRYMYNTGSDKINQIMFQHDHRMSVELDGKLRKLKLYQGGKTLVNPLLLNNTYEGKIFYYDRNSMYPTEMFFMDDLIGGLAEIDLDYIDYYQDNGYQLIYEISDYCFIIGEGCLPVFYDPFIHEYVEEFRASDYNNRTFMMFDFELDMLNKFYDRAFDYRIAKAYAIRKSDNEGMRKFVEYWYAQKAQAKKEHNGVKTAFSKLMLNSSYGKLAQNPRHSISHREINNETGAVHLVDDNEESIDSNSLLSVTVGAQITARARCALMQFMIDLCGSAHNTLEHIFYCDTDSVQTDIEYPNADGYKLGGWKLETDKPFDAGKWLAPKTYMLMQLDKDNIPHYTVHSKGVQTKTISKLIKTGTPLQTAFDFFAVGREYQTLCGLNVPGGKALVPLAKQLCRIDNIIVNDSGNFVDERM